ncbi:two-component system response regulator [Pseudomonas sp. HMWF010]|nr:two-component system response regulator [Caulobacter sp. HMWF009]PTT11302.1 two-component system response regulator [Caulobacter sp. HMWF025]PTT78410.1 two-component system response regulator [Pseudomonas sp. HMWF010]
MDLSPLSVLVVDDNANMRKILGAMLRSFGLRKIHEAEDGLSALKIVTTLEIDIIFTDLMMQPVDGLALIRWIRTSSASRSVFAPIIMITGHATQRTLNEARMAGVTEFLAKPLTARGVMHRINEVIHNPRPFVKVSDYFGPCRRRRIDHEFVGEERRGAPEGDEPFDPEDVY